MTISDIEKAIMDRLKAEIRYLKTVASISAFLAQDIENIEELAPLCPAAFVVYSGAKYDHSISAVQDRDMVFDVLAVVRNSRGDSAVRRGAAGEKGVYDLLEDIRAALSNNACGIDIRPLMPATEQCVVSSQDLSVYSISFGTHCRSRI